MKRLASVIAMLTMLTPVAARAFSVSPAIIDLSATRGTVASTSITITNADAREKTYYLQAIAFEPREDADAPRFLPREEGTAGLSEWISIEDRVRVPAGGKLTVPVKAAVPMDALPGTHYAAITVSDAPYDVVASQGAPIQARVAVLLFLTVEGGTAKAALLDFLPDPAGAIRENTSHRYALRIQNQGDVVVIPVGTVETRDLFGRVVASAQVNGEGKRVVPGSTRTFEVIVPEKGLALGPVTATLKLTYASDQPALSSSDSFWVFPWPVVILSAFVGLMGLMILVGIVRRRA
ncbi:hypothetical protein EPO34_03850 [Patescibacteria group bacterium]|nr:MAG: hypothetical protein EPO34_03850 [Patescibacteria group bacterium]